MFIKKESKFIEEINSQVTIYEHDKTKARVCTMENDDPNKVFSIAFRTPPIDNTGLTHILEHSVLCGSKKYPVKDPFVELIKGSLNTFLNAFTFPDKTMYPVASMNERDFNNLMSVYLDAVFYPNIYKHEEIFKQEGWHYHLEDINDDIMINGVVYNEMKGAFSDPEQVLGRSIMHSLYPNTPYGLESGGDPKYIPTLSYERFLEFHKKYYHPSNSYIFIYGNTNMEEKLKFIEDNYLNNFTYNDFDTTLSFENKFDHIVKEEYFYPLEENKELKDNTYLSYNVSFGSTLDIKNTLALDILTEVLFDIPGAPVKEALLKSGICKDVDTSYESGILEPFLSIVLKGSNKESYDKFISIVDNTLKDIKLDKEALLASINFREFKTREAKSDGPKGLIYQMACLEGWLYDDNMPYEKLCILSYFKELKELVNTSYFNDLINEAIINNIHKSYVTLSPSYDIENKESMELMAKLKDYKSSLSSDDILKLKEDTINLIKYQDSEPTKEELDTIPKLSLDDINKDPIKFNIEEHNDLFKSYYSNYFTNGISYVKYLFDISNLPLEKLKYAKLTAYLMGLMNTSNLTYNDINKEIKLHTGGVNTSIDIFDVSKDEMKLYYDMSYSYLKSEENNAYNLVIDILKNTIFNDVKRFKDLINQVLLSLEQGLIRNGHATAFKRAQSYINKSYRINDALAGVEYLEFIKDISNKMDNDFEGIVNNIKEVMNIIFNKNRFMFDVTCDKDLYDSAYNKALMLYNTLSDNKFEFNTNIELHKLNEGIYVSTDVNYVARVGNLGESIKGDIYVLKNAISLDYLWMNLRVKGGAYGAMIQIGRFGELGLISYRDPHVKRTSDVYLELPKFIETLDLTDDELLKLKIGAIGQTEDSYHASTLGSMALSSFITNNTFERRKQRRLELIDANLNDLKKYKDVFEKALSKDVICTIGKKVDIENDKELFKNIRSLIK